MSCLTSGAYDAYFDGETRAQLTGANRLVAAAASGQELGASQLAEATGMPAATVESLFAYRSALTGQEVMGMALPDFLDFVTDSAAASPEFSPHLDEAALAQLNGIKPLVQAAASGQAFTAPVLAGYLGMEEELAEQVFALYAGGPAGDHTLSPKQMVDFLLSSEAFVPYLDEGTLAQLTMLQAVMESTLAETPCSSVQMAQFLGMEESMVKLLYAYHTALYGDTGDWRLSVRTVVNFLVKNSREFGGPAGEPGARSAPAGPKTYRRLGIRRTVHRPRAGGYHRNGGGAGWPALSSLPQQAGGYQRLAAVHWRTLWTSRRTASCPVPGPLGR